MFAFGLIFSSSTLWPQTAAELGGTVRDASGGLVPGVSVSVTKAGHAECPQAPSPTKSASLWSRCCSPANTRSGSSKEGFKSVTETGIILQVNEQARQDFTLELGAVVEAVTITSSVPLLETATAARGQVIDNQKIVDLPLNGRDYLQLALISVGAGQVPSGPHEHLQRQRTESLR